MSNANDRARMFCLLAAMGLAMPVAAQTDPLAEPFGPTFDWRELLPSQGGDGSLGYVLRNSRTEWHPGWLRASNAGDINGDGLSDILHDVSRTGRSTWGVLMGSEDRNAVIDVSATVANDGFQLAPAGARAYASTGVGDINGDGFDDVVGQHEGFACGRGCYYYNQTTIVFGRDEAVSGPFPTLLPRPSATLWAGIHGWVRPTNAVADVNNDGINDLLIEGGVPFVVFGRPIDKPFPILADVFDVIAETGGFSIVDDEFTTRGARGGGVGDLNGDGIDDIAVTLRRADGPRGAYVIFGRPAHEPFPGVLDPTLGDASEAVFFKIDDPGWTASSVGTPGDINGDEIDDMTIGGFNSDGRRRLYVVFGRHDTHRDPFLPAVHLDALDGDDGFVLRSSDGWSLSDGRHQLLGDVNGDDVDDLLVGNAVYYGQQHARYPAVVHPDDVPANQLVRFEGVGPHHLTPAGDANGDGTPDLAAGIDGADYEVAAIIYGRRPPPPCDADMDRDGELTIFDWLTFYRAWEDRQPLADLDGDGEYSLLDFLLYQIMFDVGCP